ncbi:MAG: YdiU family protein [Chitinophagaceae bacterium]|nr:YdiU family protein [Chitinophagaceae bacterium]
MHILNFKIDNSFLENLPADENLENNRRQVFNACYSVVFPKKPKSGKLIHLSDDLCTELDLSNEEINDEFFRKILIGEEIFPNTKPFSMCYGGHQFGHWAGQLGDGRAINLFELINEKNNRWTLQLKGAGKTPYSRNADGLAVLRSSIREHLCSEAMFHLGVPTTRSLSLSLSGDEVLRDILYNGNAEFEKGAIVCRVAPSFIRFGNFEIFSARKDLINLKKLADYTIQYFYPEILKTGKEKYVDFFKTVCQKTLEMIVEWQRVGFVHGVMNTDNMSILGLSIDFGPFGFLENYDENWTPNTTDAQGKRYAFGKQAQVAFWNLIQLANALFPLIEEAPLLENELHLFNKNYNLAYQKMMLQKLGIENIDENSILLIENLKENLSKSETDFTIFFRLLADVIKNDTPELAFKKIEFSFYNLTENTNETKANWMIWFENYLSHIKQENQTDEERKKKMNLVNPKFIFRNYIAQLAIDEANQENYLIIDELYKLLKHPYDEQPESEKWFAKRPDWAKNKVGCSMLSCSS